MKPIDTTYKGRLFRSRLEARWAVAFDSLGLQWDYEPEGFELSDGTRYLPDFWLPDVNGGCWIEVKPFQPGDGFDVDPKVEAFSSSLGQTCQIFQVNGLPSPDPKRRSTGWDYCSCSEGKYRLSYLYDAPYDWCVCPITGKIGIQYDARGDRNGPSENDKGYNANHPRLTAAWKAAHQARFEHGAQEF